MLGLSVKFSLLSLPPSNSPCILLLNCSLGTHTRPGIVWPEKFPLVMYQRLAAAGLGVPRSHPQARRHKGCWGGAEIIGRDDLGYQRQGQDRYCKRWQMAGGLPPRSKDCHQVGLFMEHGKQYFIVDLCTIWGSTLQYFKDSKTNVCTMR